MHRFLFLINWDGLVCLYLLCCLSGIANIQERVGSIVEFLSEKHYEILLHPENFFIQNFNPNNSLIRIHFTKSEYYSNCQRVLYRNPRIRREELLQIRALDDRSDINHVTTFSWSLLKSCGRLCFGAHVSKFAFIFV